MGYDFSSGGVTVPDRNVPAARSEARGKHTGRPLRSGLWMVV